MWLKLFQAAIALLLKFTRMPEIADEPKFRDFCKEVLLALKDLAAITPITEDDQAIAVLEKIVSTDTYWAAFYRVLLAALDLVLADEDGKVELLVTSDPGIQECCDECGCDKHLVCRLLCFLTRVWHTMRQLLHR